MFRIGLAVALGLLLAAGVLVAELSKHEERLAGTNSLVQFSARALPVPARGERCAPQQRVPGGTAAVRVYAGTFGRLGGPVAVSIRSANRQVAAGRVPGGFADNTPLQIRLPRIRTNIYDATVCVRNLGGRPLQFAGNLTPQAGARPPGHEEIRTDWLLPGRPSGWSVAPKVARRFAVNKASFVGPWTLWLVLAFFGVVCAGAIALVARREQ